MFCVAPALLRHISDNKCSNQWNHLTCPFLPYERCLPRRRILHAQAIQMMKPVLSPTKMTSSTTRALEEFIDRRLCQQSEQLNDLFIKHSRMTKSDLDDIKKSQDFLGSKFDGLAASVNELRTKSFAKEIKYYKKGLPSWKSNPLLLSWMWSR